MFQGSFATQQPDARLTMHESCKVTYKRFQSKQSRECKGRNDRHTHHSFQQNETQIIQPGISEAQGFPTVHM